MSLNRFEVRVPMRDGVELATDVYLPPGTTPRPVLLQRTPYGKDDSSLASLTFDVMDAVDRGYAVVVQDCRGCGRSAGEFHPFVEERNDGHDAIEWAALQPWSDGRVGVYGSSYMGATALQATIDAPPPLRAAIAYITAASYHNGWVYTDGAFELGFDLRWTLQHAERVAAWRSPPSADDVLDVVARFRDDPIGFSASTFELRSLLGPAELPHWREWLDHPQYDEYWRSLDAVAAARQGRIAVPLLQVAGWYDAFAASQFALHDALSGEHRLVVGPWDHGAYLSSDTWTSAGVRDFGPDAAGGRAGVGPLALRWFDRWLRDGADHELPPVRYFAIGHDEWRSETAWPPRHLVQRWYLHADGTLSLSPPGDEPADTFAYDPQSPAPTLGGRHLAGSAPSGVQDHEPLARRDDVLVYMSAPLGKPLTLAGPVRFELHFRSSAPVADVVAVLVDILPTGEAWNIADGILRLRASEKMSTVELGHTAYELAVGHRLGLYVTSSSFPRFDRVPERATHHVQLDAQRPSSLALPVVDSESGLMP